MNETEVFGVSIDAPPSNARFAKELGLAFRLLSDVKRETLKEYGVLDEKSQFARRTTFVVDKQGVIRFIEEGRTAVDPANAITMCTTLKGEAKK
jgi:peroxiredoxin